MSRYMLGGCMALALAAGTAVAQEQHQQHKDQPKERVLIEGEELQVRTDVQQQQGMQQQGQILGIQEGQDQWRSAHNLPIHSDLVLVGKTGDDQKINVAFSNGRLIDAKLDGNNIDPSKVQFKDNQIRVLRDSPTGEDAEALVTFEIPQQILTSGQDPFQMQQQRFDQGAGFQQQRFGTMEDPWQQDRFRQDRYQQQQRFAPAPPPPSRFDQQRFDRFDERGMQEQRFYDQRFDTRSFDQQQFGTQQDRFGPESRMYGTTGDRPMLGVQLRELDRQELRNVARGHNQGMRIIRVQPGGLADAHGLRSGDVIVSIDGRPASADLLRNRMDTVARSGEDLRLTVVRQDQTRNINIDTQRFARGFDQRDMHMRDSGRGTGQQMHHDTWGTQDTWGTRDTWDTRDARGWQDAWGTPRDRSPATFDRGATRSPGLYGTTEGDIYGTTDVYVERRGFDRPGDLDLRVRDDIPSYLDVEMPNVNHPGPYNIYRPTLPERGPRR